MTVFDGDYDYYLFKKREDLAARAAAHAPSEPAARIPEKASTAPAAAKPVREGKKTREQRRAEADARAELNRRLKKTKDRLKKVDAKLEKDRARYDQAHGAHGFRGAVRRS